MVTCSNHVHYVICNFNKIAVGLLMHHFIEGHFNVALMNAAINFPAISLREKSYQYTEENIFIYRGTKSTYQIQITFYIGNAYCLTSSKHRKFYKLHKKFVSKVYIK